MKLADAIEQVFLNFQSNKFKTIMSGLGIVIGVIAIVVMLSIGEGLLVGVGGIVSGLDMDVITVSPAVYRIEGEKVFINQKPAELDDKDVHAIMNTAGVKMAKPRTSGGMSVKFRDEERASSITAISPTKEAGLSESIDKGRFLKESDRSALVIGSDVADKLFKMPLNPGMRVTITNKNNNASKEFTIAGILKKKNQNSLFEGMEIYTTHDALKDLLDIKKYTYSQILVTVEDPDSIEATSKKVEESLARLHKDEGYIVYMLKTWIEGFSQILTKVKFALGGIGAVSLAVGGVGIVNVMMLTVNERIKEIGVMKAVGASRENIRMIFILESGLLGFVSGLIGITIGAGISFLISRFGEIPIAVIWSSLAAGLVFGVVTATVAGAYPANKAAKLDPVEALRAE
ncbi:MacB-like periplasmic core domain protein [uncultured archaeon]|nr:MacB-like periplasmic core domain protein [uncultured archaeon]